MASITNLNSDKVKDPLIILSSNLCNFHALSLNNLTNPSTDVLSTIVIKCAIFDNLLHTTSIAFFSATNDNLVIKFTVKCIYSFSSTSFSINFPASTFILFFILWYKSYLSTYFPISFVTTDYQESLVTNSVIFYLYLCSATSIS